MRKLRKSNLLLICLVLVLSLLLGVGCGGDPERPTISVASKAWTEQLILGNMLIEVLEYHGYPVENRLGLGESDLIRPALYSGEVDMYWEYTGTTLTTFMNHEPVNDSEKAYQLVKDWDKEENDVVWLDYSTANNTYALLMQREKADSLGIVSLSDLAAYLVQNPSGLKLATDDIFYERADGLPGLKDVYGIEFDSEQIVFMGTGLTYGALKEGQVDVAMGFGTDGRIAAFDLVLLEDDKGFFPIYNPAPLVRQEILDAYPELESIISEIPKLLDNDTMIELNNLVDIDELEVEDVARDFLLEHGIIE